LYILHLFIIRGKGQHIKQTHIEQFWLTDNGIDGLGSVVGLTDSTGALVGNETYQYDPYGQLIHQPRTAALRTNAWRYASGYYDVSTGLYKFGIRYYDATTGRWTQRDPVGGSLTETVKVNPYVYANDDPVNLVDPSGAESCGFTVTGLVVLAVVAAAGIIALTVLTGGFSLAIMGATAAIGAGSVLGILGEVGALWGFVQQASNTSAACGGQSY
jgi:RHS repeat-associated protein